MSDVLVRDEPATAAAPRGPVPRAASALRRRPNGIVVVASVAGALILGMLLLVAWMSIRRDPSALGFTTDLTLSNYVDVFTEPAALTALRNTAVFAAWTVFWAMLIGLGIAWLVERTDLGGRTVIYTFMTVGVLIPGFFTAMGWVFVFHPRIGVVNQWAADLLGRETPLFNILTLAGMGWVQGLTLASAVFILTSGSLRSMDASLEEAAAMSGAGFVAILRRVTLPLAWPGILGALIFTFTIAIASFDVPLIIGRANRILVFSTFIYNRTLPTWDLPQYGIAGAFSVFMMVIGLLLATAYTRVLRRSRNFQVVTGKAYRPRIIALGRWRWPARLAVACYFLLAAVLPLASMCWAALLPYLQVPSHEAFDAVSLDNFRDLNMPLLADGIRNTLVLMLAAPTLAVAVAIAFSWVVLRSGLRFRGAYDFVAFLPQAVPNIIFAFAALLLILRMRSPVDLYGSIIGLVLVMALVQIAFATRMTTGSLIQVHHELEESARASGARNLTVLRRVTIPLIWPAVATAWLFLAMLSFRDLTIPTLLFHRDTITMSVMAEGLWATGHMGQAAAVTLLMIGALVPFIVVYWWSTSRRGGGSTAASLGGADAGAGQRDEVRT